MLDTYATVFGILVSGGAVLYGAAKIIGRFESHEKLDEARFGAVRDMLSEIRDDVKEIRRANP